MLLVFLAVSSSSNLWAKGRINMYMHVPIIISTKILLVIISNLHFIFSNGRAISNKVEIDSDNIETPPATRKIFPTAVDRREPTPPTQCKRMLPRPVRELPPSPEDVEPSTVLGDGQFDRFSSARRTRRYKRNMDSTSTTGSGVELSSPEATSETQVRIFILTTLNRSNKLNKTQIMCSLFQHLTTQI